MYEIFKKSKPPYETCLKKIWRKKYIKNIKQPQPPTARFWRFYLHVIPTRNFRSRIVFQRGYIALLNFSAATARSTGCFYSPTEFQRGYSALCSHVEKKSLRCSHVENHPCNHGKVVPYGCIFDKKFLNQRFFIF